MKTKLADYTQDEVQALEGDALDWAVLLAMGGRFEEPNGNLPAFVFLDSSRAMCWWPHWHSPIYDNEDELFLDPLDLLQEMRGGVAWDDIDRVWVCVSDQSEADALFPATAIKRAYVLWKLREAEA